MKIIIDDLKKAAVKTLLQEHHNEMLKHSPVECVHALDLSALKASNITFWTVWINNELAGCGALKTRCNEHGEIKSMRTAQKHLRKGVAATLLTHILAYAKTQGYKTISLETGSAAAFIPAHKLYQNFGFRHCKPFADYKVDPYSLYLNKSLTD